MRLRGTVVSGAMRGGSLMEKYYFRIKSLLGFAPYKGTLDIRLERPVNFEEFSAKTIDHVLLDGRRMVEVYLGPAVLHVTAAGVSEDHECWVVRFAVPQQEKDVIEIIDKERLADRFSLKEGSKVEVTLFEQKKPKKGPPGMGLMRRLYGSGKRLSI